MTQKTVDKWKLSGCTAEPHVAGLSSGARIVGENSKVIGTSLEEGAAVNMDTHAVNTEHQSCRVTLWCCAESDSVFFIVLIVFSYNVYFFFF
jgi:hypothetical protein